MPNPGIDHIKGFKGPVTRSRRLRFECPRSSGSWRNPGYANARCHKRKKLEDLGTRLVDIHEKAFAISNCKTVYARRAHDVRVSRVSGSRLRFGLCKHLYLYDGPMRKILREQKTVASTSKYMARTHIMLIIPTHFSHFELKFTKFLIICIEEKFL